MKSLINEYGGTVVVAMVSIALIVIIFYSNYDGKEGIFSLIGGYDVTKENTYEDYSDSESVDTLSQAMPYIDYTASDLIYKDETYDVSSLFTGKNSKDETFDAEVLSIADPTGVQEYDYKDDTSKTIISNYVFTQQGVYTIKVRTRDDNNQIYIDAYQIPVDEMIIEGGAV